MAGAYGDLSGASSALSGPPPLTITKPADGPAELPAKAQDAARKIGALSDQIRSNDSATLGRVRQREAAAGSLQPPHMEQPPPPPQPKGASPVEQWGSLAMLAAGIGSLLTRGHAVTALNAAADVMKGYHQHDQEAANAAFQRWKIANDNTIKIQNFQLQEYKAAMEGVSRGEGLDLRAGEMANRAAAAQIHALALSFGDQAMADKVASGDVRAGQKLMMDREKLNAALQEKAQKAEQYKEYLDAKKNLEASSAYQNLLKTNPLQAHAEQMDLRKGKAPAMDTRGDGSQDDLRAARPIYDEMYKDPATGARRAGAPDPETWYKTQWPSWGKKDAQSAPASPASLPPQALDVLKKNPGQDITFSNGQVWALQNGVPVQVK